VLHRSLAAALTFSFSFFLLSCASPPPPLAPDPPRDPLAPEPTILPASPLVMATSDPPPPSAAASPEVDCTIRLERPPRAGCNEIFALGAAASGGTADAGKSADGSRCTVWNAQGFAPQAVTLDMGTPMRIDVIALVPEMTPDGTVSHEVAFSDDGKTFQVGHRIEAPMRSGQQVELVLPKPERARFVRVTTARSPSWVAWREVGLFRCGTE
jgi:hypothetical protein